MVQSINQSIDGFCDQIDDKDRTINILDLQPAPTLNEILMNIQAQELGETADDGEIQIIGSVAVDDDGPPEVQLVRIVDYIIVDYEQIVKVPFYNQ